MAAVGHYSLKDLDPLQPPKVDTDAAKPSTGRHIKIRIKDPLDHYVPAILHEPPNYSAEQASASAVVLVSGAGGGVNGSGGIYPSLADRLSLLFSMPCMRLDYRLATNGPNCASDIIASLNYLSQHYRTKRFVVVGSSFSGSPCFSAAADEPERIRGIATIASHNANAAGIAMLSPRPLLLLHSTGDTVLAASCSEALCRQYGTKGSCELKLFEGDDHGLAKYAPEVEGILLGFVGRVLGFEQMLQSEDVRALAGQGLAEGLEKRGLEDEKLVV